MRRRDTIHSLSLSVFRKRELRATGKALVKI